MNTRMLSVECRKGEGTPPTLEALIRALQTGGYEHAQAVYDREALGERELAISEYRRALTLEPTLGHAIERLKVLGAETPASAKAGGGL